MVSATKSSLVFLVMIFQWAMAPITAIQPRRTQDPAMTGTSDISSVRWPIPVDRDIGAAYSIKGLDAPPAES